MISYENIETEINYAHCKKKSHSMDFHLHSGCEIYYLVEGDVNYFVEKQIYDASNMDIFITNHLEIHKPNFISECQYERVTLLFNPNIIEQFSSHSFSLLECFYNRKKGENNKISLNRSQLNAVLSIFSEIEALLEEKPRHFEILYVNLVVRLLILINTYYLDNNNISQNSMPEELTKILDYIDHNINTDLSLAFLEKHFFINRYYLCRKFKEYTNSSLHKYIVTKRLSYAKKLLDQGANVTEAAEQCGFVDYSHFIKTFKKLEGVSPGKYRSKTNVTIH